MEAVLLVIHLIIALAIVVVVLIQPSEAGGFLGNGSMSNLMMPRRGGDPLVRLTTILAVCFFATSLLLAIVASNRPDPMGVLDLANEVAAPDAAVEQKVDAKTEAPAEKPKAPIAK